MNSYEKCNGSTHAAVDGVAEGLLDSVINVLLIIGEDHESLPQFLKASKNHHRVFSEAYFEIENSKFGDAHILEI